ncbi:MAG TPA: FkbM family methyltransferase [Sphingomicrobium sp.]|nr:FkbM family methyltransferase [Sphingomicrobium sp.]
MTTVFRMSVPVTLEVPQQMAIPTQEVLAGEYDCGLCGERLTVADIGANIGAFSIWASARWPGSSITAYEPHPETFAMLQRNLAPFAGISTVNAAIYPSSDERISFFARYPGDGEAGVVGCSRDTFSQIPDKQSFDVPVIHPAKIPSTDVVKIDAEGSEAEILRHMDLSGTSLVLLEFQNDSNRAAIKQLLEPNFDLLLEEEFRWDPLLAYGYNESLAGDHYGHLFFASKTGCKLSYPKSDKRPRASWRFIASEIAHKLRGD